MFKVERFNFVVIAGASLGVLCAAGLVPVSGTLGSAALSLFLVCLGSGIAAESRRRREDRKLLAQLQEHQAVFGPPATASLTIASAALGLVDAAEGALAQSASQVAALQSQLDAIRVKQPPALSDSGASEFKNAFVTKVSHELRTPLAGINAYVELLIDGEAGDEQTRLDFYQVIHGEADRLSRIIDDIVAISRIESGVAKPHKSAVSISKALDRALSRVEGDLRQKGVTVSRSGDANDYQTFADPAMLEHALVTLLVNAIKFSPTGGGINVEIGTDPHEKSVLLTITDHGPEVQPQDLPALFDKFDGARTCVRTADGAGIALALVREIVQTVHGGRVFVESRQGRGCCFGFGLPLYAPEPSVEVADESCIR